MLMHNCLTGSAWSLPYRAIYSASSLTGHIFLHCVMQGDLCVPCPILPHSTWKPCCGRPLILNRLLCNMWCELLLSMPLYCKQLKTILFDHDWLIWFVGWLVWFGWLVCGLVDWFGWLVELVGWSVGRSVLYCPVWSTSDEFSWRDTE